MYSCALQVTNISIKTEMRISQSICHNFIRRIYEMFTVVTTTSSALRLSSGIHD